jgi:transposase InsO family protein
MFGMMAERTAKRLGLTVYPYKGSSGIVSWDGAMDPEAIRGRVSVRVGFADGLERWYRFWITKEAAGYDGILGSGWMEKEDVVLWPKGRRFQMRRAHRAPVAAKAEEEEGATNAKLTLARAKPKATLADVEAIRQKAEAMPEEEIRKRLPGRLQRYVAAFRPRSDPSGQELPEHGAQDVEIRLKTEDQTKWPREKLRRQTPVEHMALQEILRQLEKRGFIRPSKSPIASAVHLVCKGDGSGARLTIDYKKLNDVLEKDRYPVPRASDLIATIASKKLFSKVDISSAFHRLRVRAGDEWKTAFITPTGLYEWLVLPFGLTMAPACFQRALNRVLGGLLGTQAGGGGVCAYVDDILIYADTSEELYRLEEEVLGRLIAAGLPADIKKCEFGVTETRFLGIMVAAGKGTSMNPKKVEAVAGLQKPQTLGELRSAMGLLGWLRPFIPAYARMAAPVYELQRGLEKRNDRLAWTQEAEEGFEALKRAVATQQSEGGVLKAWDFEGEARVETDASKWAIGGVLRQQDEEGQWRPAAYYSRKLSPAESRYSTHDKEMLAVVACLREWDVELRGARAVAVFTDHRTLEHFMSKMKCNERQMRWKEELTMLPSLTLTYWSGAENGLADALSRRPEDMPAEDDELLRMRTTEVIPKELVRLAPITRARAREVQDEATELRLWKEALAADGDYRRWREERAAGERTWSLPRPASIEPADCEIAVGGERMHFRGRIWVPEYEPLRTWILEAYHDGQEQGHPGRDALLHAVKDKYFWPQMKKDAARYVRGCDICGRTRVWRERAGFLQPLPLATRPWSHIAMDYATLPEGAGKRYLLVIVDRFTKEVELVATATMEVEELVRAFVERVVARHGYPETIITDRGAQFTSALWRALCRQGGIEHRHSTAFHPQTDGQSERMVQEVKIYLSRLRTDARTEAKTADCEEWLPWAQLAINSRKNLGTGTSAFELLHGLRPRNPREVVDGDSELDFGPESLSRKARQLEEVLRRRRQEAVAVLASAQDEMERQANRRRRAAPAYRVGDEVWLSLANRGREPAGARQAKFKVIEVVGPRAYRLDTPGNRHNVYHTDQLRPVETGGFPSQYRDDWRPEAVATRGGEEEYEVEAVMDEWTDARGHKKLLVKWLGWHQPTVEPRENFSNTSALQEWDRRRR